MRQNTFIPEEFRFAHDYCLYLHDLLVGFIRYGEQEGKFTTHITPREGHATELAGISGERLFEWLEKEGYSEALGEIYLKLVFPGLLSDFCHFMFEALSCSSKQKLTVAYALLRKPLRENLFYMEWLLADPETFINTLHNEDPAELALKKVATRENAVSMMRRTISRLVHPDVFDAEFLYDLRFNKQAEFGFELMWNRALHLITTMRHVATKRQNLNFIFSNEEDTYSQWKRIYTSLPFLLFYAVEICEVLMVLIVKTPVPELAESVFHRALGFILSSHYMNELNDPRSSEDQSLSDLSELELECPKCQKTIAPEVARLRRLFDRGKLRCPHCRRVCKLEDFTRPESEASVAAS